MSKQFEQVANNILSCINCNQHDNIIIRAFLVNFAEHVISNVVMQESVHKKSIEEIVQDIPDMPAID